MCASLWNPKYGKINLGYHNLKIPSALTDTINLTPLSESRGLPSSSASVQGHLVMEYAFSCQRCLLSVTHRI